MSGGRPASIRYTYHNKQTRVEIDVLGGPKKAKKQSTPCETLVTTNQDTESETETFQDNALPRDVNAINGINAYIQMHIRYVMRCRDM